MKKILFLYSLCFLFFTGTLVAQEDFRKQAPKGGPAPTIKLGKSTDFKLDNGLTVIVVENDRLPRVAFQLTVDVPPLVEGDKAGAASLTGQLLRTGTSSKSKAEIDEAVDFIGASLNASSGGMFGASLTKHTDALLKLMQDVLLNPSFPQDEFDKIKQQTLSGIAFSKDDPSGIASRVANVVRYGADHPYGEFQSEESVQKITVEDCKAYYNSYFKPNISYLVIVGDITVAKAKKLANTYFGSWEKGEVPPSKFTNPGLPSETGVKLVNKTGAVQSVLNITYPIELKVNAKDRMAARVMNNILGSGSRGRLFRNLREDKGYTYGAYSTLSADKEVGYFDANASVRNEVTDSAITQFMYELERMRTEKVSAEFLQETKNRMTGIFALQTESPQTVASYALNIFRYDLAPDHYATYLERLQAVTADDVLAAAKKYIHPDKANIVIVGDQDAIADKLGQFGKVDFLDIYGRPVKAPSSAGDIDAEQVINGYFDAIGGTTAMNAVKDITLKMEASIQGQTISMTQIKKQPGKMLMEVSMMGNVMQEIKFDGSKGSVSAMGQAQKVEGEQAESMKLQAAVFPEAMYTSDGYQAEVSGVETIDNQDVYVLKVTDPAGNTQTDYFSKETGLKLRTVSVASANGQTITTTNDYSDYKEVNGLKFPHMIKSSGAMPFPINMKVTSIEMNTGIEDSKFEIK